MDKEALKKRIFAEGEKAKGGVDRFLEEEKQEFSKTLAQKLDRSQGLGLKQELPQDVAREPEKTGLSFRERKARKCRFFKATKEKTEPFIEKASAQAEERGGKGLPERKFIALKKKRKLLHAFVIPCYGESSYLEECIQSLLKQENPSPIYLCTATPNAFLKRISREYRLPLFVRNGEPSLARDWNFALEVGRKRAKLVTLAHQDDLYHEDYTRAVEHAYSLYPDASLIFTKTRDIDGMGQKVFGTSEQIQRFLRLPYHFPQNTEKSEWKKFPLLFGNVIPIPSCTYVTEHCGRLLFKTRFRYLPAWDAYLHLAEKDGRFLYIKKTLHFYRRHEEAESRKRKKNQKRKQEEREQFQKLHGKILGSLLAWFYAFSGKLA